LEELAPEVFQIIPAAAMTVAQALQNGNWIDDIRKPININVFLQV
jgi:hypothetical protein